MKAVALFFILCIIAQQATALVDVSFSGNVSTDDKTGIKTGELDFRATNVWLVPVNLGIVSYTLAAYASVGVTATVTNTSGVINGNLIVGAIKFYSGQLPLSYMGYFNASVSATRNVVGTGTNTISYNYAGSAGFVLTSYVKLEERTPTGAVVRTILMQDLVWSVTAGNTTTQNGGLLHYVTLSGNNPSIFGFTKTILKSGEEVAMTFLVSEVIGKVKVGTVETYVCPKVLESVLEVNGWQYESVSNKVVFTCGVLTGSASGESAGKVTFASGTGENQVYAHFSGYVNVGGKNKKATVVASKTSDISAVINDTTIQASATTTYQGNLAASFVEISFPAGATSILYDPSIGSGQPLIYEDSAITASFCAILLFIVVLLI